MHLAAKLGHAISMYNVAKSYRMGTHGADRDPYKAAGLYEAVVQHFPEDGRVLIKQ